MNEHEAEKQMVRWVWERSEHEARLSAWQMLLIIFAATIALVAALS
jgi:hypothetical protein